VPVFVAWKLFTMHYVVLNMNGTQILSTLLNQINNLQFLDYKYF
jgi:hypothetical protein